MAKLKPEKSNHHFMKSRHFALQNKRATLSANHCQWRIKAVWRPLFKWIFDEAFKRHNTISWMTPNKYLRLSVFPKTLLIANDSIRGEFYEWHNFVHESSERHEYRLLTTFCYWKIVIICGYKLTINFPKKITFYRHCDRNVNNWRQLFSVIIPLVCS